MNLKDLSITTVLLGMLYFTAYSFYSGYRSFYGFPTGFISVGVAEIVKFSVISVGIFISLISILHLDVKEDEMPFKWGVAFSAIACILVFGTYYTLGSSSYLFKNNLNTIIGQSLILGVTAVIGVRAISVFVRNGYKLKGKSNAVMILGAVSIIPSCLGWSWAYLPYEPLFYSKVNNAYLLETYSGKFVLGRCINENSSYLLVDNIEGDISPATSKETQELKTCFLRATKQKIPRD